MVDFKELMDKLKEQMNQLNLKLNNFTQFIVGKLKNFKNLSIGEQISYPAIGLGILLILTSVVMFVI